MRINYDTENHTHDALEQLIMVFLLSNEIDNEQYNFLMDVLLYYQELEDDAICEMIDFMWKAWADEAAEDMIMVARQLKELIEGDRYIFADTPDINDIGSFGYDENGNCTFTMEWAPKAPNLKLV